MKKYAVIGMMALSMMAVTACGNKDNTEPNSNNVSQDNPSDSSTQDNTDNNDTNDDDAADTDNNTEPTDSDAADNSQQTDPQDTPDSDNAVDADPSDDSSSDSDKKDDGTTFRTEQGLIELGENPEIELNDKGCFNGTYTGDDGCTYKFKKKGTLTIKSEEETLEYTYMLQDNILYLQAADGSMGTSRYLTLLEDGTYLLDDNNGGQVILTYVK